VNDLPEGRGPEDSEYIRIRRQTAAKVRVGIWAGSVVLVALIGLVFSLAKDRGDAKRAVFVAESLGVEFRRLQGLESEVAELRRLNDKILGMAGIHRPLPEDTSEADGSARGPWSYSQPTRAPRVGVLSRGFRAQAADDAHPGVDIPGPAGVPIRAAGGGIVQRAELDLHYGNVLVIDHGNRVQTLYGHNEELLVQEGDSVWVGQSVARLGNTGRSSAPHLHFEVRVDGVAVDPGEFVKEYRSSLLPADGQ